MPKHDFSDYICRPFCSFYRQGEKEELACRGALVAERLAASRVIRPSGLPGSGAKEAGLWRPTDALLETKVCGQCPFRPDGCDFRALDRPDGAEPCGGYILLRMLRARGELPDDALSEACDDRSGLA
jgi:hypothetical protein